jgi:hypothetical protein
MWLRSKQDEWNADLCRLTIACNVAWWASNTPFTAFSCEICAGSPGRKQSLGQIFDKETTKVVESTRQKVEGLLGTGQCDG